MVLLQTCCWNDYYNLLSWSSIIQILLISKPLKGSLLTDQDSMESNFRFFSWLIWIMDDHASNKPCFSKVGPCTHVVFGHEKRSSFIPFLTGRGALWEIQRNGSWC